MGMKEQDIERAIEQIMEQQAKTGVVVERNKWSMIVPTIAGNYQATDVFQAETTKGGKNYLILMGEYNGCVYYCHGDRAKKITKEMFNRYIEYGDLEYVPKEKVEPERISLAVLGMMAMSNGLAFEDYLNVVYGHGQGSELRV